MSRQPDEAVASDFAVFVCAHTPALLRAAYLLTGNAAAAEDLVQDTLLRLFAKWGQVQAADVPLAYVRRSMVNNFLNGRRRRAGNEVLFADAPDDDVEPDFALAADDRSLVQGSAAGLDGAPFARSAPPAPDAEIGMGKCAARRSCGCHRPGRDGHRRQRLQAQCSPAGSAASDQRACRLPSQ